MVNCCITDVTLKLGQKTRPSLLKSNKHITKAKSLEDYFGSVTISAMKAPFTKYGRKASKSKRQKLEG